MKLIIYTLIFNLSLCVTVSAFSEELTGGAVESSKNNIFYFCQRQKEVRWLRAIKLENGRCKSFYSKEGFVQVISSASYFSSCESVLESVRKNIEEGGFKCVDKKLESLIEL